MKSLSFALIRRNLGTLVLSGLILLAVAFYTLQVLPARTSRLEGRYYRVLARIGANLVQQLDAQRKTNEGIKWRLRKRATGTPGNPTEAVVRQGWSRTFSRTWPRPAFVGLTPPATAGPATSTVKWDVRNGQLIYQDTLWLRPALGPHTLRWAVPLDSVVRPVTRPDVFTYFFLLDARKSQTLYASTPSALRLDSAKYGLPWVRRDTTGLHTGTLVPLTLQGREHYLFVVPRPVAGGGTWLLCGAVPKDAFDAERQTVSGRTLEVSLLIVVLGILSLPFLKIAFMGPQERLGRDDVLRLGAALVLGTGMLLMGVQSLALRHWLEEAVLQRQLQVLAQNVNERVSQEVRQLGASLQQADAQLAKDAGAKKRLTTNKKLHFGSLTGHKWMRVPPLTQQQLRRQADSSDVLAWVDANGYARLVLGHKKKEIDYLANLSGRDYFQAVRGQPTRYRPDDGLPTATFLGSVVSYRNAQTTAVLARRSRLRLGQGPTEAAICFLSTDLLCLRRPVLPPGYGFCLMNERGEVLFHSNPQLNLSENLLEDCDPADELRAALLTRRGRACEAYYQGRDSRLWVQPLTAAQPGLFVVTIADSNYLLRTWQLQTGLAALRLLWGFWLALLAFGLLWYAITRPPALSARIRHSFPRLWPRPTYARRYWFIAGAHVLGIVDLYSWSGKLSPVGQLLALLLLPIWLFGLTAALLRLKADAGPAGEARKDWGWLVLIVALVGLNAVALVYLNAAEYGWLAGFQTVLALLLVLGFALRNRTEPALKKLAQAWASRAAGWRLGPEPPRQPAARPLARNLLDYQAAFPAMLLAWLLVLGLVPALYSYQLANRFERTVQIRQTHLSLLRQLEADTDNALATRTIQLPMLRRPSVGTPMVTPVGSKPLGSALSCRVPTLAPNHYLRFYAATDWACFPLLEDRSTAQQAQLRSRGVVSNRKFCEWLHQDVDKENRNGLLPLTGTSPSVEVLANIREEPDMPDKTGWEHRNGQADWQERENWYSTSSMYTFNPQGINTNYVSQYEARQQGLRSRADALVSGHSLFFATGEASASGLTLYWLLPYGLGLGVLLLAALFSYLVQRCFMPASYAYRYPPPATPPGVGPGQSAEEVNRFIITPADSTLAGLPAELRQELEDCHPVCLTARGLAEAADWEKWLQAGLQRPHSSPAAALAGRLKELLGASKAPELDTVVLEELDFHAEDADLTKCKRLVLEKLLREGKRVVLLSRCHPMALVYCEHPLEPPCQMPDHVRQREAGLALLDALASFRAEYLPLYPAAAANRGDWPVELRGFLAETIEGECQAIPFLQNQQEYLREQVLQQPVQPEARHLAEHLVRLTQRLAQFHYRSLWQRLSPEEQFYLYDLAQDGLVNPHNHHVMETLLLKGYLRFNRHGRLLIFNDSFRHFALSALQQRRVAVYEAKHRQNSTWAAWQLPLMLLFSAGVVFVFVTQRAAMSGAEQLLTAFVTLLPLLGRLLSSFSAPGQGKGAAST